MFRVPLARVPCLPGPAVYVGSIGDGIAAGPPITAIVNLACIDGTCRYAVPPGVLLLELEQYDGAPVVKENLDRFLEFMHALPPEASVLIHCFAGVSRAPTFALAWLMHRDLQAHPHLLPSVAWQRAAASVKAARPIANPAWQLQQSVLAYFGEPALL